MAERSEDWLRQARRDLELARVAAGSGHHEWACFSAQQAAEKAVKAVFQSRHLEAWGHVVHQLLERLAETLDVPTGLVDVARQLDRHYIPTRYPNGFEAGIPGDFYTEDDARRAIQQAESVIEFCAGQLA